MIVNSNLKLFSDLLGPFREKQYIRIDHEPCHLSGNLCGFQNGPFNDHPPSWIGQPQQLRVLMFVEIKENSHKKKYEKETGESESDGNEKREDQYGSDPQEEGKEKELMWRKPYVAYENSANK
jgi:hypothetical protein